jgi:hypothetical protein
VKARLYRLVLYTDIEDFIASSKTMNVDVLADLTVQGAFVQGSHIMEE